MNVLLARVQGIIDRINSIPEPIGVRVAGLAIALPTTIVLGLSMWLVPSPDGYGTHRQLGLAGCTLLTVTGWPCPMCGMTTTFAHLAHLHFLEAARTQPFGLVLFAGTVVFAVAGWIDLLTGKNAIQRTMEVILRHDRVVPALLLGGLLGGWLYKAIVIHPTVFGLAGP